MHSIYERKGSVHSPFWRQNQCLKPLCIRSFLKFLPLSIVSCLVLKFYHMDLCWIFKFQTTLGFINDRRIHSCLLPINWEKMKLSISIVNGVNILVGKICFLGEEAKDVLSIWPLSIFSWENSEKWRNGKLMDQCLDSTLNDILLMPNAMWLFSSWVGLPQIAKQG